MKIKILYEDENILAIDKPTGILVHPDRRSKEKTIFDIFQKKFPELEIAHRLDKETSGVLLLAKNKKAHEFLKAQFKGRTVKKTYRAIVNGWPKADSGKIDKPIGRSPSDFRRRLAGRGARGEMREAITEWKVLKRFQARGIQNFSSCALPLRGGSLGDKSFKYPSPFSVLEVFPKTGRTHQIRAHLKFLNFPIVCDPLYNPKGICPKDLGRLGLHAQSIEFKTPSGKTIKVESPIPEEFEKMLKLEQTSPLNPSP
jgi:23S rRNA pseudouridine1911/1915/1917 synthase